MAFERWLSMIIDSHFYCFNAPDDPRGYSSGAEHLKYAQLICAAHHQPAIRVRDRQPSSSTALNPTGKWNIDGLPDVNLRVDRGCARLIWTINGEDCTKYQLPPNIPNLAYTPHNVISELDHADIDMALLHVDPTLVRDSTYMAECVQAYPNRLRGMVPVDEWRILADTEQVVGEIETAVTKHGLDVIKIHPALMYLQSSESWDAGPYRPFWDAITALDVPIFFTLGCGCDSVHRRMAADEARSGYLQEQRVLIRWMERYPNNVCSLTHGFPYRLYLDGDCLEMPEEIWEPFTNPNCNIEVSFPVRLGDIFDYPWRETQPLMMRMVEKIGADHLLWGTDMPFQNRFCTLRQSRQYVEKFCDFLTAEDRAKIMGATAARILKVTG